MKDFSGQLIHPQYWPKDCDYSGKKVVIIGSGATAVTLVPAMAEQASRVVMLQRSPSYMLSRPQYDALGGIFRKLLPEKTAYALTRWKNFRQQWLIYTAARLFPTTLRNALIAKARKQLPPGYDVETHFTPSYQPWDERLCAIPDNDLYRTIREGKAEVVTDQIERFTEHGIMLKSGDYLEADIIVTATGLQLVVNGDGNVSSCEMLPPVGNIKDQRLPDLIQSDAYQTQVDMIKNNGCHCTHNCAMLDSIFFNPSNLPHLLHHRAS